MTLMEDENDSDLTFDSFDISTVLKCGVPLLASAGKEFDEIDFGSMDPRERIALQKKQLKQRLGLGTEFMDLDFFSEADLKSENKKMPKKAEDSLPYQLLEKGKKSWFD
ncbi:btaf1 RNA polymerase II, B-TFIID transcription factor-associated, 170kDa [Dinochytrium kinnereticum]|nr:btaf1 RNA polymerase II, B-TFIID transcription factor-associated, 170kDa [Dinochytrium kinnereticum]